jgi:hypothetical protein
LPGFFLQKNLVETLPAFAAPKPYPQNRDPAPRAEGRSKAPPRKSRR